MIYHIILHKPNQNQRSIYYSEICSLILYEFKEMELMKSPVYNLYIILIYDADIALILKSPVNNSYIILLYDNTTYYSATCLHVIAFW